MTSYPPPFDPTSQPQQPPPPPPGVYPQDIYAPGIYPPPNYPQPIRPTWATAIGVISIVWSSFVLICTPISLAFNAVNPRSQEMMHEMYPEWYASFATVHSLVAIALGVVLLTAGILLLKKRPAARPLHLSYAILNIGIVIMNFLVMLQMQNNMKHFGSAAMQIGWKFGFVIGLLFGLAYPIFLLAWFLRPKITADMRDWQRR